MNLNRLPNSDITEDEAALLHAAECLLASIATRRDSGREVMRDPYVAGELFRLRLASQMREVFSVMYLDAKHRIIGVDDLFLGSVHGCEVHPRVVVRAALLHNATAVIVAHNHPSGNPEPSAADRAITTRLQQALALVEIRLLDHFVVVSGDPPFSMAARGWV